MKSNLIFSGLVALIVSLSSIGIYAYHSNHHKVVKVEHIASTPSTAAVYTLNENGDPIPLDFNEPAKKVIDGVVHIKSTHLYSGNSRNFQFRNAPTPFRDFFGDNFQDFFRPNLPNNRSQTRPYTEKMPSRVGTGSGVIISEDGYIVTNNHVIAEADDIEVTLYDNRTYKARVIGTDPSTDLALLQIKEKGLPIVPLVNSDDTNIGQWVLAVGNPMGLNSTVTAGIISAKGRNINILKDKYAVEDFIQTDAAINPGNSGGALVNLQGGLVGINTAIASTTGSFSGYGFAVPANIVNKVVEDLIEYGSVQRGVLGVMIRNVDSKIAKEKNLSVSKGVYVDSLMEGSAAGKAGLKIGDVILAVNEQTVNSSSALQGMIARYRPGETVKLKVNRAAKELVLEVVLHNRAGNLALGSSDKPAIIKTLGVDLEELEPQMARDLDIKSGVLVKKIFAGKLRKYTQMRDGFVITKINGKSVSTVEDLIEKIEKSEGGIMLEGVYTDIPGTYYYAFGL